jgi:hypothetical protein
MATWDNADGLHIKFGTSEAELTVGGESSTDGNRRVIDLKIDYSDFGATGTETIVADNVNLPDGAFLESATFLVTTAFASGGSATLTFGVINRDRSTAVDADGIDATVAVTAIDAVGDSIACDGALVGTTLATGGLITSTVATAAFTAGVGNLRLVYFMP